jgi:subtilisin family serine protease
LLGFNGEFVLPQRFLIIPMPSSTVATGWRRLAALWCAALLFGLGLPAARGDDDGGGAAASAAPGAAAPGTASAATGSDTPVVQFGTSVFRQIIASGLTPSHKATLQSQGFVILSERNNGLLQKQVTLLQVPVSGLFGDPVARVRALGPAVRADENHVYRTNAPLGGLPVATRSKELAASSMAPRCSAATSIAMIDTAVDSRHPALRGARIEVSRAVTGPGKDAAPAEHGTAVASLLVGQTAGAPGIVPQARLLAIDAFHTGRLGDQRMDAYDLAAALDIAGQRGAKVVNMSFDGPPNTIVQEGIEKLHRRGVLLVAAVGNGGPLAPPGYPAAYPGVIAVTAVGPDLEIYRRATRGRHVAFAAVGVERSAASIKEQYATFSGTSFAAPTVAGLVAHAASRGWLTAASAEKTLANRTRDLGSPGRDETFGYGYLDPDRVCPTVQASR